MFSCSLFFTAAHFCLGGHKHFSCFSSNKIGLFYFFLSLSLSLSSSFSVIHVNLDIKIKSKKRIGFFVVVFIS